MKTVARKIISETQLILQAMLADDFLGTVDEVGRKLIEAAKKRQTIFIAGNGGSWADADHFAGELRAQFEVKGRNALPALALPVSLSTLTAWGNDYDDGFETAMERDLQALAKSRDMLIAISTSGKAKNIRRLLASAKTSNLTSIAISGIGPQSEDFGALANYHIKIPHDQTARIQESYQVVIHILCTYIDSIKE